MKWEQVKEKFGFTPHRLELIKKFEPLLLIFKSANCNIIYLDGSFVTDKLKPGNIDLLFDFKTGEDVNAIYSDLLNNDPILDSSIEGNRDLQKDKYGVELFYAQWSTILYLGGTFKEPFIDFFQRHRDYHKIKKGIVKLIF